MSGALIGFAGAIGALGGVGINLALRQSYLSSDSATSAFWIFLSFYVVPRGDLGDVRAAAGAASVDTPEPVSDLART